MRVIVTDWVRGSEAWSTLEQRGGEGEYWGLGTGEGGLIAEVELSVVELLWIVECGVWIER